MNKMKNLAALGVVILFSLFTASCQPKDDYQPEEATLSLSSQAIMMDNKAQTAPEVTFETNQTKVVVSAPADWLDATVQGSGIIIKAEANTLGKERKGEVLVFAGSAMDKITVIQSAADIVLEVSPDEKTVTNVGEEFYVSVTSNTDAWVIEPSAFDWIKVEKFTSELLKVTVLPNNTPDVRVGQLLAKQGSMNKEITITQVGVGKGKYALPLMHRRPSRIEVLEYERNIGSYYLDLLYAMPEWGFNEESLVFASATTVFHTVTYKKDIVKDVIVDITMESNDPEALKSVEYKNYLKDNGFVIGQVNAEGYEAVNDQASYAITVEINTNPGASSVVRFVPIIKQEKPYPTFKKFPWSKSDILRVPEWTSEKIIEMEKSEGSSIELFNSIDNPDILERIQATLKKSNDREVPHTRVYLFDPDDAVHLAGELLTIWEDVNLGAWQDGKTFYYTEEFTKLMADEGFEFLLEKHNLMFYYNKEKKMVIVPRGARFEEILDGAPVFSINYFPFDADAATSKDPVLQNMFFEKISVRLKAMEIQ